MKREILKRLINVGLRGLSMGSRFVLILALAKLLEPSELGLFGLMLATVAFCVLLIGADYYTYSQRELLARPPDKWSFVIQHQLFAQIILYCILLPFIFLIFVFELMDWQYAAWFYALLITEHIAQEINRLLIAMNKQLMASIVLFFRMGAWVLIIIPFMYWNPDYRGLNVLYVSWLLGGVIAIIIGSYAIKNKLPVWGKVTIDSAWLIKGFKIGGLFLLATLCFRGLLTFDRYVVEAMANAELLGVYFFYIGLVMGIFNFLEPAVFSFLYPRMLQTYQAKDKQKYNKVFKELIISTLLVSVFLSVVIWLLVPFIIQWIDKPIYANYLNILPVFLILGFIYAIGYIPHYALYAMKADKWIVAAHVSALSVFFLLIFLLDLENAIQTVAVALSLAFSVMGVVKMIGYYFYKHNSLVLNAN